MTALNFPKYSIRIKNSENKALVFDIVRKKYVRLQPEEWVRQHCLHYLVNGLGYPAGHILVERQIRIGSLRKRVDVAVCDTAGAVRILVECKAPDVDLSQAVFDQIARYNLQAGADYLMITNGLTHWVGRMDRALGRYESLGGLPAYGKNGP